MYGGSTTAILVNIPGEVASVVTTLDGYQMARQGRAGPALAIAAISSFVAGTLGLVGLTFFAPPLADVALRVGPPEYVGLVVLAFSVVVSLSGASLVKGLSAAALGALVALAGLDPISGVRRFTFGTATLLSGIDFIAVIIGRFAITEVLVGVEAAAASVSAAPLGKPMPEWRELRDCVATMLRAPPVQALRVAAPRRHERDRRRPVPGPASIPAIDGEAFGQYNGANFLVEPGAEAGHPAAGAGGGGRRSSRG